MIVARGVGKSFGSPAVQVLKNIDLDIKSGEFVALTGRSGSGKSTLLYIISSLDQPTAGVVSIDGVNLSTLDSAALHQFRNQKMGFVFQFHYLLPELTSLENVLMPAVKCGQSASRKDRALALLDRVGLKDKANRLSDQLSGGEQQRVAIARALIMEPAYLFADEPTGNLDSANGLAVMEMIKELNKNQKTTVVMVTHDSGFAAQAQRSIHLVDGAVSLTGP